MIQQVKISFCILFFIIYISMISGQTTLSPEAQKKLDVVKSCAENKTINVKPEEVKRIIVDRQEPTSHEGMCYTTCVFKNVNYMYDNASMILDSFVQRLDRLKPTMTGGEQEYNTKLESIKYCVQNEKVVPDDHCVTADNFIRCIIAEKKKKNITTNMW